MYEPDPNPLRRLFAPARRAWDAVRGNVFGDIALGLTPAGVVADAQDITTAIRDRDMIGGALAAAGLVPIGGDAIKAAGKAVRRNLSRQTVGSPVRNAFPAVYDHPRDIADRANQLFVPESENLSRLFDTTREELASVASRSINPDYVPPGVSMKGRGFAYADDVRNPRNTARIRDVLEAGIERAPELVEGMRGWYIMDPAYRRLVELVGPEEARKKFIQFQALTGMASPGSDVVTELRRGTVANQLANSGEFDLFREFGGIVFDKRPIDFRSRFPDLPGHPYHSTHAPAMQKFLDAGKVEMDSPKVPAYIEAALPPELGGQTSMFVGDAHWSRAVGLPDVRRAETGFKDSVSNSEAASFRNWWRDRIAKQVDMEPVPAQASLWGLMAPSTGVDTVIGAPKLEILADEIVRAAKKRGIPPEQMRDEVLLGNKSLGALLLPSLFTAGAGARYLAGEREEPR